MGIGLIIGTIGVIICLWGIWAYNRFILLRGLIDEAWSGISVQLKRRHDLIPNLIETVKGYANHERSTLEQIVTLRNQAVHQLRQNQGADTISESESALGGALGNIRLLAENYPNLQASQNFITLQNNLAEIEEQLQMARRYYNGTVRNYQVLQKSFPSLLINMIFSFPCAEFFSLPDAVEAEQTNVSFK